MIRVKICGITSVDDARVALEAGADAIGLVFHEGSPRRVSIPTARAISDFVGDRAERIGVLVDASPAELVELAGSCRLSRLQLHLRSCPRGLAAQLPVPVLPYLGSGPGSLVESAAWWPRLPVLLDSIAADGSGGTGDRSHLDVAAALARHRPVWLAGGLGPDNVAEAIRVVRPQGVDASSRLEAAPGRKDPHKVAQFVAAARAAARSE